MNLQYFEKPLQPVQNYDAVSCPYVKIKNNHINTSVPQPHHLNGKPVNHICVPNLSDRMMIPGFGLNYCENNKPIHLNFNERSECYAHPECKEEHKIQTCIDPYMQN